MKFYKWLIALVLVCSVQAASAQVIEDCYSYDPCCEQDSCCSNFNFSVYGDLLWWKVCRSELDFQSDDVVYFVSPKYDSGYRIGAKTECKCIDLGVRYTSYETGKSRKNPGNTEQVEHLKYKFDYSVFDIELGFNFDVNCACGVVRPFAGVKFADIDEKYDLTEFNSDLRKLDFRGTGLYLGAEGRFNVYTWESCNCGWSMPVNLVIRGAGGALDGKFHHHSLASTNRKDECIFVPVRELSLVAEFELNGCSSCFHPKFRLGYETNSFGPWREFDSDDDSANLGLGGMVLGLEVDF